MLNQQSLYFLEQYLKKSLQLSVETDFPSIMHWKIDL